MTTIYTIGHSTRTQSELTSMLNAYNIQVLADIRSYPGSRKFPHFNQENMVNWLHNNNIKYTHIPKLGGRRRKLNNTSVNEGWRNISFRNYADYTLTNEFEEGIGKLLALAAQYNTCYMCSEAVPWRCHRNIVSDVLTSRGYDVKHIMGLTKSDYHSMTKFAIKHNGKLIYPGKQMNFSEII